MAAYDANAQVLRGKITNIANTTNFNTVSLLDRTFKVQFQIDAASGQSAKLTVAAVDSKAIELTKIALTFGAAFTSGTLEASHANNQIELTNIPASIVTVALQ